MLEAGIAGKPVIVPFYHEAAKADYRDYVHLFDYFSLFDVAKDEDGFVEMVLNRLESPVLEDAIMDGRKMSFERYVSPLGGDSVEKYCDSKYPLPNPRLGMRYVSCHTSQLE